jgi:hypothetical protein
VSLSCGSLWFIDAGSVSFVETDQPLAAAPLPPPG